MPRPFDAEILLARPLMSMVSTLCADGPRNAPMWFLWEDGALWLPSYRDASSVRRIEDDPRVAVEIVDFDNEAGRLLHLGVRGRAAVVAMEADRFRRLLAKYLGPDPARWNSWFITEVARIDDPSGRLIRVTPESIFTNNVSYFRTGPEVLPP